MSTSISVAILCSKELGDITDQRFWVHYKMNRVVLSECWCNRLVLDMRCQDTILDTVYLQDEESDRQVVEEEVFGVAHGKCLSESQWSDLWLKRMLHNLTYVRRLPIVAQNKRFVLYNAPIESFVILGAGGTSLIEAAECVNGHQEEESWIFRISNEIQWDLSNNKAIADALNHALTRHREVRLCEWGEAMLGADARSLYSRLDTVVLRPVSEESPWADELVPNSVVVGMLEYDLELTLDEANAVVREFRKSRRRDASLNGNDFDGFIAHE